MPARNLEAMIAATREVGDMAMARWRGEGKAVDVWHKSHDNPVSDVDLAVDARLKAVLGAMVPEAGWLSEETANNADRSEEHTSELQSLMRISYAVFCLNKKSPTMCGSRACTLHGRAHDRHRLTRERRDMSTWHAVTNKSNIQDEHT